MSDRTMFWILAGSLAAVNPDPVGAQARPLGSLGEMRGAAQAMEWEGEDAADQRAINEAGRNAVDSGLDMLDTGMNLYDTSRGFTEADAALSDVLNQGDSEFDPSYSPEGAPTVPVHCETEGGADCTACYASGYETLNFVRFYLERLRAIYGATRNYTESAIAFGDAMAGLPGGFGLGWPPERQGIQEAFDNLGQTYDEKYQDYMRELRRGLEGIAACESEFFGEEDWYSRFGFIYYSFLEDRYRR